MDYGTYEKLKKSALARLQARRLLSDYSYWYRLIVRGLIFLVPMAVIFIIAVALSILDEQRM